MTWTIYKEIDNCKSGRKLVDLGDVLCTSLVHAYRNNRVTCGVLECAKLLRSNPDNVMLCVLPEASGQHDVILDIQHTLIEAFCWENDIKLVKVDSEDKLSKLIGETESETDSSDTDAPSCTDVTCMLIEFSKEPISSEDTTLIEYVTDLINNDVFPKHVIELPI